MEVGESVGRFEGGMVGIAVSQSASPRAWGISWGAHIETRIKDIARERWLIIVVRGGGWGTGVGHHSNSFRRRQSSILPIARCLSTSWKPTVGMGRCRWSSIAPGPPAAVIRARAASSTRRLTNRRPSQSVWYSSFYAMIHLHPHPELCESISAVRYCESIR